jgi:hypothetical protein
LRCLASIIDTTRNGLSTSKGNIYYLVSVCLNIYVAVAVSMFVLYLGAFALGGKLSARAVIVYGSWIVMGLYAKTLLKKSKKGRRIGLREHILLCMYTVACMFLWFPYVISVFFSVLSIVGIAFSYKAHQKRMASLVEIRTPLIR